MDFFWLDNLFFLGEEREKKKKKENIAKVKSLHAPPYVLPYIGEDSTSFWKLSQLHNSHLLTPLHALF